MTVNLGWPHFGLLILCVANISLGMVVIARNPRAARNQLFLGVVLAVVSWVGAISTALSTTDPRFTVWLGRLGFASVTTVPPILICLFRTFSVPSPAPRRRLAEALVCGLFVAICLSPWVVAGATSRAGRPNFVYGPLHPVLGGYLMCCLLLAISTWWRALKTASGIQRLQLRHLGTGIFLGGLGIAMTNLIVPLVWKTSYYSVFGPYFTLIFVSFSAHAIIRHRLMEIRFVVRRGVVYVSALAAASLVFLAATALTRLITGPTEPMSLTAAVVFALIVSILFQPLKQWIDDSFNRYLYREPYNYQRTVRLASRRLSTILDPQSLIEALADIVEETLRVERVAVYMPTDNVRHFALSCVRAAHPGQSQPRSLWAASALLTFLGNERRPFLREGLPRHYPADMTRAAAAELERLGGDIAFPLLDESVLSGVLVVGPKLSGDPYHLDDIDLISTVVGQAASGMRNANLYREVVLANERTENILETMESGVIVVTTDEIVTMFNSAAHRITGVDAGVIKGKPLSSLPADVTEPIRDTLRDLRPRLQVETVVKTGDRGVTPVLYSTSTMKDRSGAVFAVVGVFSDVSRLRELEEEKRRTERLASIGALAAGMAHEIKNPLVAIRLFAELLPERFGDEDFRDEFSRIVLQEIERIDQLLGRLRGLTSAEAPRLVPVPLRELLEETLGLLRAQLEHARITVRTACDERPTIVSGDRGQLKQLLLNVLINAIEAMPEGGELALGLRGAETGGDGWVVLTITDTGGGIPDGLLGKLFEPFVTSKDQGSGLGLSICRGITEAHRGSISVANNPDGPGATVTIELPAGADDATAPSSLREATSSLAG